MLTTNTPGRLRPLGIGFIRAHSPQAKSRIERLWATLQDRLTSELRLRGIRASRTRAPRRTVVRRGFQVVPAGRHGEGGAP